MRARTVFNWIHGVVTTTLLLLVMGFLWLNKEPDYRQGDTLIYQHEMSPHRWLYTTQNNSGGATVATVYRYFLSDKLPGNTEQIAATLKQRMPFLQGSGTISAITPQPEGYQITYSGNVLSLHRSTCFTAEGQSLTVHLNYQIR